MLAEMGRFLKVHHGRSVKATPSEALQRATLAPAEILGLNGQFGRLEAGRPMSFIEIETRAPAGASADVVIRSLLPADLNAPEQTVRRVTIAGRVAFEREAARA
jgi:cytosine/adenosine deaminase-related metal-dependent hydrolase